MSEKTKTELSFEDLSKEFAFQIPTTEESTELEAPATLNFDTETKEEQETETEEVVDTPPVAEEEKPKEQVKAELTGEYSKFVQKLLKTGQWEDVLIKTEEHPDGIALSELDNISEEEFEQLSQEQLQIRNQDLEEKYVPVSNVDENKKLLIDIIAKGGDLKDYFQSDAELIEPFSEKQGWNLKDEKHLAQIVYQQYINQGLSEKRATTLVQEDIKDMELETKALKIVETYRGAHKQKLIDIAKELEEETKKEQEEIKQYRSELSKRYKEKNLPESLIRKAVDLATKKQQDGTFGIDNIYEEKMKDVNEAEELLLFLTDKEKYLQLKMQDTKLKTELKVMREINRIPKTTDRRIDKAETENKSTSFKFELP